jgi:phage baseplate assembly protein W
MARTQTKSDVSGKAIITSRSVLYSDFDLAFIKHPNTKDVTILKDLDSVKQSIKNLILTSRGERPFNPNLGSGIRALLFEPADFFTSIDLQEAIEETVLNFEPRVNLLNVDVDAEEDFNRFKVSIEFQMITNLQRGTTEFFLERIR